MNNKIIDNKYFLFEKNQINKRLKVIKFSLNIEFFLADKLSSLMKNKSINVEIKNIEDLKKVIDRNFIKLEKENSKNKPTDLSNLEWKKSNKLVDQEIDLFKKVTPSITVKKYFYDLSFGKKILFLKSMKSIYWNKLFSELTIDSKKFTMGSWNRFFNRVRLWRNTASHTNSVFYKNNPIDISPISRKNKDVPVSDFVLVLEKQYHYNFGSIKIFIKDKF